MAASRRDRRVLCGRKADRRVRLYRQYRDRGATADRRIVRSGDPDRRDRHPGGGARRAAHHRRQLDAASPLRVHGVAGDRKAGRLAVWKNWSQANGLAPDDVEIVYDGSSTNRLAVLVANVVVVAPVNQPLDMMALDRGYKKLIEVPTYAPARTFGFTSIAARSDWVAANGDALRAFLRAEARGID